MSHVATVDVEVTDLDALEEACKKLGLELKRGKKTYRWYGHWVNDYHGKDAAYKHGIDPKDYGKCDHAISIPGDNRSYEVGVVKSKEGNGYKLIWDFFGGGGSLMAKVGKDATKLRQAYAAEVAAKALRKKKFRVEWKKDDKGNIKLIAKR